MVEYDQKLSSAIEDYLKAIYVLQQQEAQVGTVRLADRSGFKPASVFGMLKKLSDLHLVDHTPYYGVVLTPPVKKSPSKRYGIID